MDNTLPLSTLVLQPWNPLAFDHAVERTWRPVIIFLPVVVILLNSIVVLTAAFNAKLRMEIALFAWNGLFFFMCVGNVLYAACVVGFEIKLSWAEQWEQVGCSQIAAINVFFVSFDMFISLCLTTERIFMVIFVRRMSPALVFWCAGLAVVLSAGNSFVSQLQSPFIFGSGLSCAVPYPLALGIFDMIVIATTLVLLIVGNTICIWRLRQMSLTTSVPLTMVDTHLSAAHKTTSFLENGPTPLLAQRNNAERRIQRQFTIRGILAALSCGFIVVPMASLMTFWSFLDRAAPIELELVSMTLISLAKIADPLIVLAFEPNLRAAILKALTPDRRHRHGPPKSNTSHTLRDILASADSI